MNRPQSFSVDVQGLRPTTHQPRRSVARCYASAMISPKQPDARSPPGVATDRVVDGTGDSPASTRLMAGSDTTPCSHDHLYATLLARCSRPGATDQFVQGSCNDVEDVGRRRAGSLRYCNERISGRQLSGMIRHDHGRTPVQNWRGCSKRMITRITTLPGYGLTTNRRLPEADTARGDLTFGTVDE